MIQEAYISFETAKLLKEKGFDENISMVYMSCGDLCKLHRYDSIRNSNYNDITKNYFECTAPTHQMVMKWLREVHKVLIVIDAYHADQCERYIDSFEISIYSHTSTIIVPNEIAHHIDYEEAVEAAVKYTLENLI